MSSAFVPQIKLSSQDKTRRRAPIVSAAQPICQVCGKQVSNYTCPHCNLHYCSLPCFRAPTHEGCSEAFDRSSLVDEIQSDTTKNDDEKRKMMDLLRRFEDEARDLDEHGEGDGGEDDGEAEQLEDRLRGVDLDSLSPDTLLALLSPAQLAAFQSTLADPTKVTALVDQEFDPDLPWWELPESDVPFVDDARNHDDVDEDEAEADLTPPPAKPPLLAPSELPPLRMVDGQVAVNGKLVYNVVAVLFAYAYTIRTFALESFACLPPASTERHAAAGVVAGLLPFLVDKTTDVFDDVGGATDSVVGRERDLMNNPALITLLMADVARLLLPTAIAPVSESPATATSTSVSSPNPLSSHPSSLALYALSDLLALLSPPPPSLSTPSPLIRRPTSRSPVPAKKAVAACQKLRFYAAVVVGGLDRERLRRIAERAGEEADRRGEEDRRRREEGGGPKREVGSIVDRGRGREGVEGVAPGSVPRIVELE